MARKLIIGTVVFVLLLAGMVHWWVNRPIRHGPGYVAMDAPKQGKVRKPKPIAHNGYRVTPLATFDLRARVLSVCWYGSDREADLAPVDLAMGWGPMSDETVLDEMDISQSGRFYYWSASSLPIPKSEIIHHSANMHIIPATPQVEAILERVRVGHIAHIQGFLVQVDAPDGWHWKSSLSRTDSGDGACEVIFAKSVELHEKASF